MIVSGFGEIGLDGFGVTGFDGFGGRIPKGSLKLDDTSPMFILFDEENLHQRIMLAMIDEPTMKIAFHTGLPEEV